MIKLSIVIINYNTFDLTTLCLTSIGKQYKKQLESSEFEIIVVDNKSTDDSVESLKSAKGIELVENKENYGFAKGANIGAAHAKGKYILFLNSDTEVKDGGFLDMISFLEEHIDVGILGGRLVNLDGSLQASTGKFYNPINTFLMLFGGERAGFLRKSPTTIGSVDWVSGAAMMVKRDPFDRLGGFDEAFFMYVEDMELCFRAKKLGILTYFYPGVIVVHKELGSGNKSFAIISIYKGLLHFYKKHANYVQYIVVKSLLMTKALIAIILGVITGDTYLTSTYRKALLL